MPQYSQSGRIVSVVAFAQGVPKIAQAGDTTWTAVTNETGNTPPMNFDGIIFSTSANQKLFCVDGTNYCFVDPSVPEIDNWVATAGTLPEDADNNTARLIELWRGRVVLSGLIGDPQNWFMSRKDDPFDYDYGADANDPSIAVVGNNSPAGTVGDVVNAMIPYTDDVLVMGGDHTLWLFNGDPQYGGQIDLVSSSIGMAFGRPWCMGADGAIYFYSSRNSVFRMIPGQQPVRLSSPIQNLLDDVDTGGTSIQMQWDDRFQGFHLFLTPLERDDAGIPQETTHYFWESRTAAWWQDKFLNTSHNPLVSCVMDGNESDDRVILMGSWDGYVRAVEPTATTDDGEDIESSVVIGPLLTDDLDDIMLKSLQVIMGTDSGDVTYEILVGQTAEGALQADPRATGTWKAGRNYTSFIRASGHAIYVRIRSTNRFSTEQLRAEVIKLGKVRGRGKIN